MCDNRILLKGDNARKVVEEAPDTTIILREGLVVKTHRVLLSCNSFLHQLINSSWVAGDNSTFLMPQHSVEDLMLTLSLPLDVNVATNGAERENEMGEAETERRNEPSNEPPSSHAAETKVEESDDHDEVEHHPHNDEEVEETGERFNDNSLLSGFEPTLKQNLSPGFEQMMKQVETLRKRLQPEPLPPKSPFCKRMKMSGEVNNERSIELNTNNTGGGDLNTADQLEDTIQRTFAQTVSSDQPGPVKSESDLNNEETKLGTNFSPGHTMFPVKKGKKGLMFTKDDEHEWHLFKLNASKPKFKSDYYHCHRCSAYMNDQ